MERVAPHAGAWIETDIVDKTPEVSEVAPHPGAWIEYLQVDDMETACSLIPTINVLFLKGALLVVVRRHK